MAKTLTVVCENCGKPTKVYGNGASVSCVWCKREANSSCRKVKSSLLCEKCCTYTGDDLCSLCSTGVSSGKKLATGKKQVDYRIRSMLLGPYISWQQFNNDIVDFSDSLKGKGYDAVIGVPRSGLMVATQMSIRMGVPLYSVGEYGPIYLGGGLRVRKRQTSENPSSALLVEDSIASGSSMRESVEWMGDAMQEWNVKKAAVYATEAQRKNVHEVYRTLELPHWFEWHLVWSQVLMSGRKIGVDFDGILCPDFTSEEDDDGWRYIQAMQNTKCLVPQKTHIYAIITARLEKYRPWTEQWLKKHGITFENLIMGGWETKTERERSCIGSYKAGCAEKLGCELFIESCPRQAVVIKDKASCVVLCPELGGSIAK